MKEMVMEKMVLLDSSKKTLLENKDMIPRRILMRWRSSKNATPAARKVLVTLQKKQ
jgi:hypothetical protein